MKLSNKSSTLVSVALVLSAAIKSSILNCLKQMCETSLYCIILSEQRNRDVIGSTIKQNRSYSRCSFIEQWPKVNLLRKLGTGSPKKRMHTALDGSDLVTNSDEPDDAIPCPRSTLLLTVADSPYKT
jgi:hypothetical protein